jgi:hypothetical protein
MQKLETLKINKLTERNAQGVFLPQEVAVLTALFKLAGTLPEHQINALGERLKRQKSFRTKDFSP